MPRRLNLRASYRGAKPLPQFTMGKLYHYQVNTLTSLNWAMTEIRRKLTAGPTRTLNR